MSAHTFSRARRARGFSLVELATTLSIVAVLAGFATPSLTALTTRHRVQDATTDLFAALLKTRGEALMLNSDVSMVPVGGNWSAGWRVVDPSTPGAYFDVHDAISNVAIAVSGATAVTYQFNGRMRDGAAPAFEISSTVPGATTRACVSIDPSGRPYAKEGSCAG